MMEIKEALAFTQEKVDQLNEHIALIQQGIDNKPNAKQVSEATQKLLASLEAERTALSIVLKSAKVLHDYSEVDWSEPEYGYGDEYLVETDNFYMTEEELKEIGL